MTEPYQEARAGENEGAASAGMGERILLIAAIYLIMLAFAVSVTMIGPLMPLLIREYGLRLSQGGLIMTAQSIGGLLAIVAGGLLADRLPKGVLIACCFAGYVLSLFLISAAPMYGILLLIFFMLGASTRLMDTVNNALTSDLYPNHRGVALNLLHTFFGIGALLGPLFTRLVLNQGIHWSTAYSILGTVCLAVLVFFVAALSRQPRQTKVAPGLKPPSPALLFADKRMWLLCAIMIMYVGHQAGLVTWLPMYFEDVLGTTPFLASLSLSLLWVGIIIGRFSCARLSTYVPPITIILWGSIIGGLCLLTAFSLQVPQFILAAALVAGLSTGAVIPLLVSVACSWFPNNSATASSMIFLSGSAATMVFPWFIGWIAEYADFTWGISMTGMTLIVVFGLSAAVQRQSAAR